MSDIELNSEARITATIPAKELFRLAKEISNLRYALERIRDCTFGWRGTNAHEDVEKLQKIAREALE